MSDDTKWKLLPSDTGTDLASLTRGTLVPTHIWLVHQWRTVVKWRITRRTMSDDTYSEQYFRLTQGYKTWFLFLFTVPSTQMSLLITVSSFSSRRVSLWVFLPFFKTTTVVDSFNTSTVLLSSWVWISTGGYRSYSLKYAGGLLVLSDICLPLFLFKTSQTSVHYRRVDEERPSGQGHKPQKDVNLGCSPRSGTRAHAWSYSRKNGFSSSPLPSKNVSLPKLSKTVSLFQGPRSLTWDG